MPAHAHVHAHLLISQSQCLQLLDANAIIDDKLGIDFGLGGPEIRLASSPEDDLLAYAAWCWQKACGIGLEPTHVHACQAMLRLPGRKGWIFVKTVRQVPVVGAFDFESSLRLVLRIADGAGLVANLPTLFVLAVLANFWSLYGLMLRTVTPTVARRSRILFRR